uniref:Uncharacterized protein n=1 Tax=Arundo donax TaxID=35708 RepID=A0A0A9CAA2_ARUDO
MRPAAVVAHAPCGSYRRRSSRGSCSHRACVADPPPMWPPSSADPVVVGPASAAQEPRPADHLHTNPPAPWAARTAGHASGARARDTDGEQRK